MESVSFEEMKEFIVSCYKSERLYGRNKATGWDDGYGDRIVKGYFDQINGACMNKCVVSRHESLCGLPIFFDSGAVIKYALKDLNVKQLLAAREAVTAELNAMDVTLEKINADPLFLKHFSIRNVRRNLINQRLRYHHDYLDSENKFY